MKVELLCAGDLSYWKSVVEDFPNLFQDVSNQISKFQIEGRITSNCLVILEEPYDVRDKVFLEKLGQPFLMVIDNGDSLRDIMPTSSCISIIDKSWPREVIATQLACSIGYFMKGEIEIELDRISSDLSEIVSTNLTDFQTIKKLHEKFVPLRTESAKGITFSSKYAAGERAGGEFFDIIKSDSDVLVILSSTSSYVGSSLVLGHFEKLRNSQKIEKLSVDKFIVELSNEADSLGIGRGHSSPQIQILLLSFNLKTLQVWGYMFGDCRVIGTRETTFFGNNYPLSPTFMEKAQLSFTVSRGENICLLSPGFLRNAKFLKDSYDDTKKLKEALGQEPYKFLNELFFQIKKDISGDFLDFDASAMHIKVDENVLVQV